MTEKETLVALAAFVPFGPARLNLLLNYFESAKNIWRTNGHELTSLGLGNKQVTEFLKHRENFDEKDYFNKLKKYRINVLTIFEKKYPTNLRGFDSAPIVLYVKGTINKGDANAISIIGSRKMTSYGKEVAWKFSSELVNYGVTIVSGLARGIDTVAHSSAITAGGRTIAVLASGLDTIYPPENASLANKIAENGALISEYPLGHPAFRANFANRNRIISGLSKAVLVVEGAKKSGTLLTASHAANQGIQVFAVPGPITSPLSGAPLFLLKNGAFLATSPKDIVAEMDLQLRVNSQAFEELLPATKSEAKILEILANEPLHLDEVVRISSSEVSVVVSMLTVMEMKGLVKNLGGGIFRKV